jgi:hypothetical protein
VSLQRDIDWYDEGERDADFVDHLVSGLIERLTELEARLAIDKPNPFPEGFDALDLTKARIAELEAELDALDAKYVTVQHELAALIPVAGACPECGIDPAELATWKSYAASVDEALKNVTESAQGLQGKLAALKGRRCEGCRYAEVARQWYCDRWHRHSMAAPDFSCAAWEARHGR